MVTEMQITMNTSLGRVVFIECCLAKTWMQNLYRSCWYCWWVTISWGRCYLSLPRMHELLNCSCMDVQNSFRSLWSTR